MYVSLGQGSGLKETGKDIVAVGADNQLVHRQTAGLGRIRSKYIAEITSWHREGNGPIRRADGNGGVKVIDDLGRDPRPVDRIDRRQTRGFPELCVSKHRLY